ncbi:hypothetical protein IB278_27945 [Variovorax sp. VRV01]|uniref:hypothetical protein n=1 Tax=Variovorax sp. VRV01 TaxID=2769259 RepID=UPI00177AB014|nr:hypothetical protein [Variovorax sp. VRV01]MBD9667803.1 hypothetical protein [Variovorax sp. VRV01]
MTENIDAFAGQPSWKRPLPGAGSSHVLVDLKDEIDVRFICDVLTDFMQRTAGRPLPKFSSRFPPVSPQACLIYLLTSGDDTVLLQQFFGSFGHSPVPGLRTQSLGIGGGQSIRFIDLAEPGDSTAYLELDARSEVTLVRGAERVERPRPDLALEFRFKPPRRQPRERQFLFDLYVSSYSPTTAWLATHLSPKWWSMNDAYETLRAARQQSKD